MSKIYCEYLRAFNLLYFLGKMSVTKRTLFLIWHEEAIPTKKFLAVENYVLGTVLSKINYTQKEQCEIGRKLRNFASRLIQKWKACGRSKVFFEKINQEWLDTPLVLLGKNANENIGRPEKEVSECCRKTQVNKMSGLTEEVSCEGLLVAASCSLYKAGKRSASKVIEMVKGDEDFSGKVIKNIKKPKPLPSKFSDDKALALFVDLGHTRYTWNLNKKAARNQNADIYPCYEKLRFAKKSAILVTLQSLIIMLKCHYKVLWTIQ